MDPTTMNRHVVVACIPFLFVFLWSTGFVGAKYGMSGAEPASFLALRFLLAGLMLLVLGVFLGSRWPGSLREIVHSAVAGILIHGVYLGGVFAAIYHGFPAGVSAVIVGVHPLVTAFLAARILGEKLSVLNVAGLLLATLGIVLVIGADSLTLDGLHGWGISLSVAALFGISVGTFYQKRYCSEADLLSGTSIQYFAAMFFLLVPALALERNEFHWTPPVVGALLWLVIALSLIAVLLLMYMIRNGEANRVASLFYLVAPLTALETWILFDEQLSWLAVCGILLCVGGVYLARKPGTG